MANEKRGGSEVLKTIAAILVIGGIVVATFLYGNRQRQEQVRRDRDIRQQQEEQAARENGQQVAVNNTPDNTEVKPEGQTSPAAPAPAATPAPAAGVGGATSPAAPTTTPETGPEEYFLLPLAALVLLWQANRSSKRNLRRALMNLN
jgi:hypothetical protein